MALLADADSFFGTITTPAAIESYGSNGGLIKFGNNIIVLAVVVGGLLTLFNMIQAGYIYITSAGDAKAHEKVLSKFTMSLFGMAIMILAPALMAVMGFVFFKDSTYFLKPNLKGIEGPAAPPAGH